LTSFYKKFVELFLRGNDNVRHLPCAENDGGESWIIPAFQDISKGNTFTNEAMN
jgi:metallophosphoesterase superfamily enzyme